MLWPVTRELIANQGIKNLIMVSYQIKEPCDISDTCTTLDT